MRDQNAPRCPNAKRLETLITKLSEPDYIEFKEQEEVLDALAWLQTFLENRKLYHKKMQLKTKHLIALAKERGLDEEATKLANDEVFNIVANEEEESPVGPEDFFNIVKEDK